MRVRNYSKSNKNNKKDSERGARTHATIRSMFLKSQQLRIFLKRSSRLTVRSWSDRSGHQLSSSLWSFCWQVRPCKIHPPPKTLPQIHDSWRLLKTKTKHYLTIVMLGVHQSDTNTPPARRHNLSPLVLLSLACSINPTSCNRGATTNLLSYPAFFAVGSLFDQTIQDVSFRMPTSCY